MNISGGEQNSSNHQKQRSSLGIYETKYGGGISNDRTRSIGSGGGSGESLNNSGMMNLSRYGESTTNNNRDYPNRYKKYIFKEGDWECSNQSCKNINFSRRTKCNKCGAPKPQSAYYFNNSSSSYGHSGNSEGRFGGINSRHSSAIGANCNYRTISHSRSRSRSSSGSSRSRSLMKKHNYQSKYTRSHSRSSYSRERERIHERPYQQGQQPQRKSFFGGPPGLFKEGDWRCDNCQNINFKWRVVCNKCQYSKREHDSINYRINERGGSYYGESRGSGNRYYHNISSSNKGGYGGYYRNESGNSNARSSYGVGGAVNSSMRSRGGYGEGYGSGYGYGREREVKKDRIESDNVERRHEKTYSSSSSSRKKSSSSSSSSSRKSSSSSSGSKTPRSDSSSKSDGTQ